MIGREFDYDILQAVVSQSGDELVEALEEGVEARVLREVGHVGRYGFTHALVRATLYDSISQLRRARLHGRVGEVLVRMRGGDLDPHLAMLAHHFAQAAPVERPDRAIDFALAAARRADRMLAWEEAAMHYRAALRARELAGAVDDHVRAELLLALGASEDRAGLEEDARETFQAAIRTARQLGDPVLLSRGALGVAGPWSALSRSDAGRVSLLEEALEELPDEDSPLRARLLARMSLELYYAGEPELRLSLSEEAMQIASRIGDPRTLAICLDARHYALWLPENVEERLGGRGRAAARGGGDRRSRARAAGRGLDDHRPDGARRHPRASTSRSRRRRSWPKPCTGRSGCWWTSLFRGRERSWTGTSTRPSSSRRRRSRSASAARPRTRSTTTRRRCSTSAASRAGWPRSRARCAASSSSTRRSRPGARRWRFCWSSWAGRTRPGRSSRRSPRAASRRSRATPTG